MLGGGQIGHDSLFITGIKNYYYGANLSVFELSEKLTIPDEAYNISNGVTTAELKAVLDVPESNLMVYA